MAGRWRRCLGDRGGAFLVGGVVVVAAVAAVIGATALLRRNLLVYGVGGIVAPFVGIKIIDVVITTLGLA